MSIEINFENIPVEVVTYRILPDLNLSERRSLSLVSTTANKFVKEFATQKIENNITFEGTRAGLQTDGTISALFRQMYKMEILNRPGILDRLVEFRAYVKTVYDFEGLSSVLESLVAKVDICNGELKAITEKRNELGQALILFSLEQPKFTACEIGRLLQGCLNFAGKETFCMKVVLSHPGSVNVPAQGERGLGDILESGVGTHALPLLLAHTNAKDIPAVGEYGMGRLLKSAAYKNKPQDLKPILAHPHTKEIPANGEYGLGDCLFSTACRKEDTSAFEEAIFSLPNATSIQAGGSRGLGSALVEAARNGKKDLVKRILLHSNAKDIPLNGDYSRGKAMEIALRLNKNEIVEQLELHCV
jgi:hypothetical protein